MDSRTAQAMDGKMDFTESFECRLKLLKLSRDLINGFLNANPLRITPGVECVSSCN